MRSSSGGVVERSRVAMTGSADDPRLAQLVDTVRKLASGDLSVRMVPSTARDTIDAVTEGINLLAEELAAVYQHLEARVAERTAGLADAQRSLQRLALTDALTGLANRSLLADRIGQALARAERGALPPAVILMDLDEFKVINDSLGHSAGDAVLVEIAERLRAVVRETDTIGRLGGDEFAIVLPDTAEGEAVRVAGRALVALQAPVEVGGREVSVTASIGLRCGVRGQNGEALLRDADVAMYRAKSRGKANVQVFEPSMHEAAQRRMVLLAELTAAIDRDQLWLLYQPIVELADGRVVGAEALLRWQHDREGTVLPGSFLELAEESGLICELGRWALDSAVSTLQGWLAQLPADQPFTLHLNISPRQLRRPGLVDHVRRTLEEHRLPASRLAFEVTEAALRDNDPTILRALGELRALGIEIQIGDFGAGASPLVALRDLPVDTVKLDRALMSTIDDAGTRQRFARAMLELVTSVGMSVVVQGVETEDQLAELRRWGVRTGQGYHFGRPVPAERLLALALGRAGHGRTAGNDATDTGPPGVESRLPDGPSG